MTQTIALDDEHDVPETSKRHEPLLLVRRLGYTVLALQFVGLAIWSSTLYSRFAVTSDFAIYHQGWFLIAHGDLDPFGTVQRIPFWQNHSEFIFWPLALLYWIWPHGVTLLWLQDACTVGAEAVAFSWMCEAVGRRLRNKDAAWLAGIGLGLFAANPWIWWGDSNDFHTESLAIFFAMLLARDLANHRKRAWAWVIPLLGCSVVAASYLIGLGAGAVLASRRSRATGALMVCTGLAATVFVTLIHGNKGSALVAYNYLAAASMGSPLSLLALVKGIASHPMEVLRTMWSKRVDILANLAPAGLIGIGELSILPVVLVVLATNVLYRGLLFAQPTFQSLPVYVFMPVGAVLVLRRLALHRNRVAMILGCLLVIQAVCWAVVWAPRVPIQWLRVSQPAAVTLANIESRIPSHAEVIASQGIVGRFSGRADVHPIWAPGTLPVRGQTWFVIAPAQGIEIQSTGSALALIGQLSGPMHATLVTHANGVWAFRWNPPAGVDTVNIPRDLSAVSAWAASLAPDSPGRPIMNGPLKRWHMTSTPGKGYIADEIAWRVPPGRYDAHVSISTTVPVDVEVWNDTGNILLARRSIPATKDIDEIVLPVDATTVYHTLLYSGWGPFRANFLQPLPGQLLEVRVWSPGGGTVNVYKAELTAARGGSSESPLGREGKD